jgi:hypothetical protein
MHENFLKIRLGMSTPCMRDTGDNEDSGYRCDYGMRPGTPVATGDVGVCQAYSFIVLILATYSLISKPFAEHANYDNDSLSVTSYHYSRAGWMFLWAVLTLIMVGNPAPEDTDDSSTSSRLLQATDDENASCNEEDGTGCDVQIPAWITNYQPTYKGWYYVNFIFLIF